MIKPTDTRVIAVIQHIQTYTCDICRKRVCEKRSSARIFRLYSREVPVLDKKKQISARMLSSSATDGEAPTDGCPNSLSYFEEAGAFKDALERLQKEVVSGHPAEEYSRDRELQLLSISLTVSPIR